MITEVYAWIIIVGLLTTEPRVMLTTGDGFDTFEDLQTVRTANEDAVQATGQSKLSVLADVEATSKCLL